MICRIALVSLFVSGGITSHAQDTAEERGGLPKTFPQTRLFSADEIVENVKPALEAELDLINRITDADEETLRRIREASLQVINVEAERMAGKSNLRFHAFHLPERMFAAVSEITRKEVPDAGQFRAYREDAAIRRATAERAAVGSLVIAINDVCGLTGRQLEQLKELGTELYRQGRFGNGTPVGDRIPQGIVEDDLKGILQPSQLAFFRDRDQSTAISRRTEFDPDKRREELTIALRRIADAKIGLLDSELGLSESQRRRLTLLSRRVLSEVIGARLEAEKEFAALGSNLTTPRGIEVVQMIRMTHGQLFESFSDTWSKAVSTTLNDTQRDQFKETRQERQDLAWETMHSQLFFRMADQMRLTGKQQNALRELVLSRVKQPTETGSGPIHMMQSFKPMLSIAEKSYRAILNDDQWVHFAAQLEVLRRQLEQMEP